jgi:hypothetical protein
MGFMVSKKPSSGRSPAMVCERRATAEGRRDHKRLLLARARILVGAADGAQLRCANYSPMKAPPVSAR